MSDIKVECAVCLEILEIEDKATTECGHEFHLDCIKSLRNPTCPYCRSPLNCDKLTLLDLQKIRERYNYDNLGRFSFFEDEEDEEDEVFLPIEDPRNLTDEEKEEFIHYINFLSGFFNNTRISPNETYYGPIYAQLTILKEINDRVTNDNLRNVVEEFITYCENIGSHEVVRLLFRRLISQNAPITTEDLKNIVSYQIDSALHEERVTIEYIREKYGNVPDYLSRLSRDEILNEFNCVYVDQGMEVIFRVYEHFNN